MSQIGVNEQTPREIVAELDKYIVGQHATAGVVGSWTMICARMSCRRTS